MSLTTNSSVHFIREAIVSLFQSGWFAVPEFSPPSNGRLSRPERYADGSIHIRNYETSSIGEIL